MSKLKPVTMVLAISFLLAPPVLVADIMSNITADIISSQIGDNTAFAINNNGSENIVKAIVATVNVSIETNIDSQTESTLRLNINALQHGSNFAKAISRGGYKNYVEASTAVLHINIFQR